AAFVLGEFLLELGAVTDQDYADPEFARRRHRALNRGAWRVVAAHSVERDLQGTPPGRPTPEPRPFPGHDRCRNDGRRDAAFSARRIADRRWDSPRSGRHGRGAYC